MTTTLTDEDIAFAGVAGQRDLLRRGAVTSVRLLEISLARIERLDRRLNAFRTLFSTARAEAEAADTALAAGDDRPLLGVPMAVKDYVAVTGHAPAHGTGSPEPAAAADAEVVRRLRAAGAVVVGTTNLPELALWPFTESDTFGATRNPWDPTRTPGGSSGGSAAAVASGMVAAALASDGGGSIRIPAACCGLVGLKPTRDLVSLAPLHEHWFGLSVAGCLTRTVADQVLVLNVLQDVPLEAADPGPLRVAWSLKGAVRVGIEPEVKAALHEAVRRLDGLGHRVVRADPRYDGLFESFVVRFAAGAAQDLAGLADPSATERRTRAVAAAGRRLSGHALNRARRLGDTAALRLPRVPGGADVLITPTIPGVAPPAESLTGLRTLGLAGRRAAFTTAWNVTGQPALSVPVGFSAEGLPLAVQLIGPPGSESLLLGLAAQLEQPTERRPGV
ncbi:MAG TPA: amidase family protein [Mycobacteriales bacterium]|nr:amidase family protein [Mycobacteriales bacterium]